MFCAQGLKQLIVANSKVRRVHNVQSITHLDEQGVLTVCSLCFQKPNTFTTKAEVAKEYSLKPKDVERIPTVTFQKTKKQLVLGLEAQVCIKQRLLISRCMLTSKMALREVRKKKSEIKSLRRRVIG